MTKEVHNIRDLLIYTIGAGLQAMRARYAGGDLEYEEANVAAVLDSLTILSLEKLIEFRKEHGFPGADPQQ